MTRPIADFRFVVGTQCSPSLEGFWLPEPFRYDLNIGALGLLSQDGEQQNRVTVSIRQTQHPLTIRILFLGTMAPE